MSIIIPPYLSPVLWYYGLQHYWPGIDEDKVVEWGDEALAWLEVTETFTKELITLLGEIGENTETEVFVAIRDSFEDTKEEDFDPWLDLIKTGVPTATSGIHITITGVKSGVLGILVTNVAADIPLIMSGVGLFVIAAKKAMMKALLDVLLSEALEVAVAELTQVATKYIETYWLDSQKDQLKAAIAKKLTSLAAKGVSDGGSSANAALNANTADVTSCIIKLGQAVDKFSKDTENAGMAEIDEDKIADDSVIGSDRLIRIAVAELLDWGVQQLQGFAIDLALALLDSLTEMLTHADETLTEAEQQCYDDAAELRLTLAELRPAGRANASAGAPDFFAPVRDSMGLGTADADVANPDTLDEPVSHERGAGRARANTQDISVLNAPVDPQDAAGRASGADSGDTPEADGTIAVTRGAGRPSGDGSDQPDIDPGVDATEGVDVPSGDSTDDVTELDAEVTPVN